MLFINANMGIMGCWSPKNKLKGSRKRTLSDVTGRLGSWLQPKFANGTIK
jgi:hypothetical protein